MRILRINSGTVRINNLTLKNGRADDIGTYEIFGGAIYVHYGTTASLTVSKSHFIDNIAPGAIGGCASNYGGAITAFGTGGLIIEDSVFRGNRAANAAAVIAGSFTELTIRRSSFTGSGHPDPADDPLNCRVDPVYVIHSGINGSLISNVTVSGNSASGISITRGTTTIRHSTIINNKSPDPDFGSGISQYDPDNNRAARVNLYNSIIANNTPFNCRSGSHDLGVWLTANVNNLIKTRIVETEDSNGEITRTEHDDCGTTTTTITDDPRLASFRGSPGYHPLLPGSPAIDAAPDDVNCLDTDIRGVARPVGAACDIGAYEGFLALPVEAIVDSGPYMPTPAPVCPPCADLLARGYRLTATYGLESGVQFRQVDAGAIGDQSLLAAGFLGAVDVYGYAEQGVGVCFPAAGRLLFLDAAFSPRAIVPLSGYTQDGMTCADFDRPGTLLLLSGSPPPAGRASAQQLSDCMVTTEAILNFRQTPGGERLFFTDPWGAPIAGWLPQSVTLTVLERSPDWFKVDYHGNQGWISARHVTTHGVCG